MLNCSRWYATLMILTMSQVGVCETARKGLENVDTPETLEALAEARLDWSQYAAHDPASKIEVDTSAYGELFEKFGDHGPNAALDYLYLSRRGLATVDSLSQALQKVPVSQLNRDEQLAYWLNLHNIQAIRATTRSYPLRDDSTRQVILSEPWAERSMTVEGKKLSLRDLEARIILRQWPLQEVLYGLYLPASGAPSGPTTAFRGRDVWKQLKARARVFVNGNKSMEFVRDELHVSALYVLAPELFPDDNALINHFRKYANPKLKKKLEGFDKVTATWINWRLNSFNSGYDVGQDRGGGGS